MGPQSLKSLRNRFLRFRLSNKSSVAIPSKALLLSRGAGIDRAAGHNFSVDNGLQYTLKSYIITCFSLEVLQYIFISISLIFSHKFLLTKTDHFYYIISHNLGISACISIVSFNTFFSMCINCNLILWPRALLANLFVSRNNLNC